MTTSKRTQDLNLDITQFHCQKCQQPFTEQDKQENNWELWWNTTQTPEISKQETGFLLTLWVKEVKHRLFECPNVERCQSCYQKFPIKQVKEFNDYYYCQPCYQQITGQEF